MKWYNAILAAGLLSGSLSAGPIIQQNFEDQTLFKTANQAAEVGDPSAPSAHWVGFRPDFSIVKDNSSFCSGEQAFKITRLVTGFPFYAERTGLTIPENRDYTFSFDFKPGKNGLSVFGFRLINKASGKDVVQLHFHKDNLLTDRYGNKAPFKVAPDQWQTLTVKINPGNNRLEVSLKTEKGDVYVCKNMPLVKYMQIDQIDFFHMPGMTEPVLIDNVNLSCSDGASIYRRENLAVGMKTQVTDKKGVRPDPRLVDGNADVTAISLVEGFPAELLIDFGKEHTISTVRLHSGAAQQYGNPSSCTSVTKYKVEVFSTAAGKWREMALVDNAPVAAAKDEDDTTRFSQVDFQPIEATMVKITLLDGSDTGKRADRIPEHRVSLMREVEIYAHQRGDGVTGLGKVLAAELRLPVYRDQKIAHYHAVLDETIDSLPVELSFRDRNNGFIPAKPMKLTLKAGENIVPIDISNWPNGEFRVLVKSAGSNPRARGEFGRLLRLDRIEKTNLPLTADWTGKRLFFPDNQMLSQHEGVTTKVMKPEIRTINKNFLSGPKYAVQLATDIDFLSDGRLALHFVEMDREWKNPIHHYAVATPGEWKWEVLDEKPAGFANEVCDFSKNMQRSYTGFPGNPKVFRMYDPERDGKVDLKQLHLMYTGYQPRDMGILKSPSQTTWLIWKKSPSEFVLLQDKPFLRDGISGNEAEDPNSTNDNFAGEYLSEDGKTYFYVRGHTVKRYAPMIARYDNLWMAARMLTVFSTQDGFNWKRHYYALPDESDPITMQHYGANIYKLPGGNGLMMGFQNNYSALHQQYDNELVYSWDGIKWERFPGHEPWIKPGPPRSWNFGWTNMHNNIAERDGKLYHVIGVGASLPHFAYEVSYVADAENKLDAEMVRQKFERREITKWPFWKDFGSYEKLAEHLREDGLTCGVAISRVNGWFGLDAENNGSFTTRPLRAKGKLAANFKTAKDGFIELEVLDADGKVAAKKRITGDAISEPVFDQLPAGDFQIRGKLCKATLFTLDFI